MERLSSSVQSWVEEHKLASIGNPSNRSPFWFNPIPSSLQYSLISQSIDLWRVEQEGCGRQRWVHRWRTGGGRRRRCGWSTPGFTRRPSPSPSSVEPPLRTTTTTHHPTPTTAAAWTTTSTRSCRRPPPTTARRTRGGAGSATLPSCCKMQTNEDDDDHDDQLVII